MAVFTWGWREGKLFTVWSGLRKNWVLPPRREEHLLSTPTLCTSEGTAGWKRIVLNLVWLNLHCCPRLSGKDWRVLCTWSCDLDVRISCEPRVHSEEGIGVVKISSASGSNMNWVLVPRDCPISPSTFELFLSPGPVPEPVLDVYNSIYICHWLEELCGNHNWYRNIEIMGWEWLWQMRGGIYPKEGIYTCPCNFGCMGWEHMGILRNFLHLCLQGPRPLLE